MAAPKLTPAFNMFVSVSIPTGMAPGNELSSLTVVNGEKGYIAPVDGSVRLEVTGASDWMLLGPNTATATVDARVSATGPDGINLDLQYMGKFTITPRVTSVFTGTPGSGFEFGEEYFYTIPRISSRSKEFGWVNDSVFVAVGRAKSIEDGAALEIGYQIFKVG
ncbi:hypothetical protein BGZ61DRAFT_469747 [Ilyonectria robusta]|uniref:uncharacterized protein n=1 Tax=Ilyonectria robusta TaxID=1079257 RepID=UPI001E8E69BE|nr:uncharacterized protein BGZ61DRAFT_469747 [Ilyonectria robusta]KAH8648261.1 hypothetical protein BGZ61DRAFT_469747 [Ilyonectria robusta]